MTDSEESGAVTAARQLLSGRLQGTLATQSREHPGFPFGSLLPYSIGRDWETRLNAASLSAKADRETYKP